MIEIDGSYLEGGGQILRTSIALSAITGQGVHIFNIRRGRGKPGLRPQHLEGIAAAAKICAAEVQGMKLNSMDVHFAPGKISGGNYTIDIRTAGSIILILQTLVPIGLYANSTVNLTIKGGTAVPFSPTSEYFRNIFCYYLGLMGTQVSLKIKRHGFYPAGGGIISVEIRPGSIGNLEILDRGDMNEVEVLAVASEHLKGAKVSERMIDGFKKAMPHAQFTCEYVPSNSPGCFIHATAHYEKSRLGASALGRIGKRAEDVGKESAEELQGVIGCGAPIDSWMVDQIVPYMALATHRTNSKTKTMVPRLTKHAETNIWVVKEFLPVDFQIENNIMTCSKSA